MNTCTSFYSRTASQQALRHGLSLEVDRLKELIGKLENKVQFFYLFNLFIVFALSGIYFTCRHGFL